MATIQRTIPDWNGPAGRIERVKPDQRRAALAVLLTGRVDDRDPSVDQFLAFTGSQGLSLDDLWTMWDGNRMVASALVIAAAGRTAMMFLSPRAASAGGVDPRGDLVRTAVAGRDPEAVRMIQCLLDPGQHLEKRALIAGGFHELATLLYLQRTADMPPCELEVGGLGLTVRHWSDGHRSRFAQAIAESYVDTLDCPGLIGVRPIEDVIEGHRKTGLFHPDFWFVLHHDDEPAAVLLVNEVAQHGAHELVYLGVCPAWRGRGLGKRLLRHALGLTQRAGSARMLLAVDEANKPALRLYRSMGFQSTGRKTAMIHMPQRGGT